ncbi:histidine kinase [Hymenobacter sp. 5317J-9]|uniref:sensor histidine kinase n=1 Tax=Hymenobacter sp. 5317J-9 TaxID=2932250 RepID=UPI001FD6BB23|nr:histidine kinase [Hymenobacter sp. 5317J-9]UOQ99776.1 histidine kinase [Hymenobacter sp. 5317J-9]
MAQAANPAVAAALRALDERRWLRHGLFWSVRVVLMAWLFLYGLRATTDWRVALHDSLILLPPQMLATYALLYGVLPWLPRPEHRGRFGLLLLAWLVLGLALTFAHRYYFFVPSHHGRPSAFSDYYLVYATGAHMPLLLTAGVAACLRVYRQRQRQAHRNAQLAQENFQAELQLLRAQIHPHFLFNTLNNLYSLTLKQSDQAPVVVERLTGLLHFVVEQGNAPLVPLADEVALLRNYLALEQLRYGPRLTLDFQAEGIGSPARIAPLLLLPLVENAFKHGAAEQVGAARIRIVLSVAQGWFTCVVVNSKNPDAGPAAPAGIGLRNVRERLRLLYPERHRFALETSADTFVVRLALHLADEAAPAAAPEPAEAPVHSAAARAWAVANAPGP